MRNKQLIKILLYISPIPVIGASLLIGPSESVTVKEIFQAVVNFLSGGAGTTEDYSLIKSVVVDVRLPRILLTFITGGALAASGCAIQAIFRNPLTDPYILGLSSGAAFGAALAIAFAIMPVQLSAFIFGLIAVLSSYFMARKNKNISVVSLILSGIIVSGLFTALLTIIQYLSDPFKLQTIIQWTMGNLHNASWARLGSSIIPVSAGLALLVLYSFRMNALSMGDDEAGTSGINPGKNRIIILLAAALATSAAVSVAGVIGLYGLIVPHMVRMMAGTDNRQTIPLNFLFGGTFLLIIDNFSRTISGYEIPIGVFTMIIGAPFFIYLMKKTSIGWN